MNRKRGKLLISVNYFPMDCTRKTDAEGWINPASEGRFASVSGQSLFCWCLGAYDVDGQKAAMRGVGIMFCPVGVEHQIAGFEDGAIIFDQLAFEDQELFMAVVDMLARPHSGGHAVDVKTFAERLVGIELQDAVAQGHSIRVDEGCEICGIDVCDAAVCFGSGHRLGLSVR